MEIRQVLNFEPAKRITGSRHYKWWAYATIAIGLFLSVTDQTSINIALPIISEHFDADIPTAQWIALGYILSTSAMFMPAGRLSDMIGRKYVYMGGFVIFITGAVVGGMAQSFPLLIVAKIIQGVGAAGIEANGMAMVADIFPERERGRAMGLYMAVIGVGAISGPVIGGLLVSELGWRAVFWFGVPVSVIALAAALPVLHKGVPREGADSSSLKFDWGGAALSSAMLIVFLLVVTNAHELGWTSPLIIVGLAFAVVCLWAFIWWEGRVSDPMLDIGFFKSRVFSLAVSARFISFFGMSSVFFLMPFYLVQGLGYEPKKAALFLVPGSIFMTIFGPLSGQLSDRLGTRWLTVGGMALSGGAFLLFSQLTIDSPPIYVAIGMALQGMGIGLFSSPNTSAIMGSVDNEKFSIASAFLNTTRTTANLSGIAMATAVVTFTMGASGYEPSLSAISEGGGLGVRSAFVLGLSRAFMVSAGLMFVSMLISVMRKDSPTEVSSTEASE